MAKPSLKPFDQQAKRVVRVFISSTFADMHEEREELTKYVFPQLRKLCRERNVVWGEVDLRWGVTDEQKAEGKVLPICLEEIKRCHPYFIGVLGERYGWVPDEISEELVEREEWLREHRDHSVTELEILHGVLKDPDAAGHAFFYFRDPEASRNIEEQLKKKTDYVSEPEESKKKLQALKQRIKESYPATKRYSDVKEFANKVLKDLTDMINRLYPKGSEPDPLDREAAEHEAFALSRAKVYVGRAEYFQRLDDHVAGSGAPLVVLGESGSGKSALLANWAIKRRRDNPDTPLIVHFAGSVSHSTSLTGMLIRIMGELKQKFALDLEIPEREDKVLGAFKEFLHKASEKGEVVLIVDALNQLEAQMGAHELNWLPEKMPDNVRVIVSTLPGRPLEVIEKRGWQTMEVYPLNEDEAGVLITEYLAQYSKRLDGPQIQKIISAPQTKNPFFLQTLLEELRIFGKHELLNQKIDDYLQCRNLYDLLEKVFVRLEDDYEGASDLVGDALSLIWVSRNGLTETELTHLLGSGENPLPHAIWSPFFLSIEHYLVDHAGRLNFSHEHIRNAVYTIYLPNPQTQKKMRMKLVKLFRPEVDAEILSRTQTANADGEKDAVPWNAFAAMAEAIPGGLFAQREYSAGSQFRIVDELLWQLSLAEEWGPLRDLLIDPNGVLAQAKHPDIIYYWSLLEKNSYNLLNEYHFVVDNPGNYNYFFVDLVGGLLAQFNYSEGALLLSEYERRFLKENNDQYMYQTACINQGLILVKQKQFDKAMDLFDEAEKICSQRGDEVGLQRCYQKKAIIYEENKDYPRALELLKEAARICLANNARDELHWALGHQAGIYEKLKKYDKALILYKEKERICRDIDDSRGLDNALVRQLLVYELLKDYDKTEPILFELQRGSRKGKFDQKQQKRLNHHVVHLIQNKEHDKALRLLKEQESTLQCLDNKEDLILNYNLQAGIYHVQGDHVKGFECHKESEMLSREIGDEVGLAEVLVFQIVILNNDLGRFEDALPLIEEAVALIQKHGLEELAEEIRPLISGSAKKESYEST